MGSVRQKKELIAKVASDIMEHGLAEGTTVEQYVAAVQDPTVRRSIIKNYKSWGRLMLAIKLTFPKVFEGDITPSSSIRPPIMPNVQEHVAVTEAKVAVKEELSGLSSLKKAPKKEK